MGAPGRIMIRLNKEQIAKNVTSARQIRRILGEFYRADDVRFQITFKSASVRSTETT